MRKEDEKPLVEILIEILIEILSRASLVILGALAFFFAVFLGVVVSSAW